MLKLVRDAKLVNFTKEMDPDYKECYAFMDTEKFCIKINRLMKMSTDELRITLMHEALHGTVERRGRRCNPLLATDTEHFAMAMLGERDEFANICDWHNKRVRKFMQ